MKQALRTLTGPRTDKQVKGHAGEDNALAHLGQQGLTLVARNFRCKCGEIDLIMWHGDILVFIEVRQREKSFFGGAAASVTRAKQARLIMTAQFYLQRYRTPPACRFDVIAIDGAQLTWLKNAIQA
jgi:putative endonuclease